jgi:hypothetical protein
MIARIAVVWQPPVFAAGSAEVTLEALVMVTSSS